MSGRKPGAAARYGPCTGIGAWADAPFLEATPKEGGLRDLS